MNQKLPVYIALDCSGSMEGEPIETVEQSVAGLLEDLRMKQSDASDVWVSLATFSDQATEIQPLTPVADTSPPTLEARGGTDLKSALELVNGSIKRDLVNVHEWLKPEVIVMTDGQAPRNWHAEADELQQLAGYVMGVGIGPGADLDMLREISSSVAHLPSNDPRLIKDTFEWMGDVIRVAAVRAENRVFPAPPASVAHLAGDRGAHMVPRRWSDDPSLTDEQRERYLEDERKRKQAEMERWQEGIRRREEERKRREEEATRRREEEEGRRQMLEGLRATVDHSRRPVHAPARLYDAFQNAGPRSVAAGLAQITHFEHEMLLSHQTSTTVRECANRCGMYIMALSAFKSELSTRREEFIGEFKHLAAECLRVPYLTDDHRSKIGEATARLQTMERELEDQAAYESLYDIGMVILNVLTILEAAEDSLHRNRLREVMDLLDKNREQAILVLRRLPTVSVDDTEGCRLVALAALERAANEICTSGNCDLAMSFLEVASRATPGGSPISTRISILELAIDAIRGSEEVRDNVTCTVFAPPSVKQSAQCLVQVLLHLPKATEALECVAVASDITATRRGFQNLELPIRRKERLTVSLCADTMKVDEPVQEVVWNGETCNVQFFVRADNDARLGEEGLKVVVASGSVPLGKIRFLIQIVPEMPSGTETELCPTGENAMRFRKAFVSYAREDIRAAIERTSILQHVGIEVFLDLLTIEPGEQWETRVYEYIDACDLFFLIWSKAAKDSIWVRKESNHALLRQREGDQERPEIVPVILPPPPPPEPWEELRHLQFSDPKSYLSFMQEV